jgi:methylated-DNA-protein-cysteine methyltransferase-like protein
MRTKEIKMSPFATKVIALVKKIPRGKVASYGQIARLAGKPYGARGVGWILHACAESHSLPWQRVLNSQGKISFPVKAKEHAEQKRLLKKEGVAFISNSQVDLEIHLWEKDVKPSRPKRNQPRMFN